MPIQHTIWKGGAKPEALTVSKLATAEDLEHWDENTSNRESASHSI
jgi:hypothetical protein